MDETRADHQSCAPIDKRTTDRQVVALSARLTWKDQRGTMRFATVFARNVSAQGIYVECPSFVSIPRYRLVQLQLERDGQEAADLPEAFKRGRVLSAVYRVSPAIPGGRLQGLALRLMIDPKRRPVRVEPERASA